MMETFRLTAASVDGRQELLVLDVDDSGDPSIKVRRASGASSDHFGIDLFECLKGVRLLFEAEGLLVCCQGARPSVFPSGMGRQMSNGRLAYPMRRNPPLSDSDLIDIFAPAEIFEVGTVADQRQAVLDFFRSPRS